MLNGDARNFFFEGFNVAIPGAGIRAAELGAKHFNRMAMPDQVFGKLSPPSAAHTLVGRKKEGNNKYFTLSAHLSFPGLNEEVALKNFGLLNLVTALS